VTNECIIEVTAALNDREALQSADINSVRMWLGDGFEANDAAGNIEGNFDGSHDWPEPEPRRVV
jgi:hypothetical protein